MLRLYHAFSLCLIRPLVQNIFSTGSNQRFHSWQHGEIRGSVGWHGQVERGKAPDFARPLVVTLHQAGDQFCPPPASQATFF